MLWSAAQQGPKHPGVSSAAVSTGNYLCPSQNRRMRLCCGWDVPPALPVCGGGGQVCKPGAEPVIAGGCDWRGVTETERNVNLLNRKRYEQT